METRRFGKAGLDVPALGLGGGALGDAALDEQAVARLVDAAFDRGATLIDTAPSYGASEERIGRLVKGRRERVTLVTKVGYAVPGVPDWTGPCVAGGVDLALRRLGTDVIDVVMLHSCPREVLARGDVIDALVRARMAGKIRVAGYSGDGEALEFAISTGSFGAIETSVSPWDQASLARAIPAAISRGVGVIAKRPLANAPWRFPDRPAAFDVGTYWDRFRALAIDPRGLAWDDLAIRFATFAPGVSTAIVGTKSAAHLARAADAIAKGPLPDEIVAEVRAAFSRVGAEWPGLV